VEISTKLNLGCGRDIRTGFVNLDSVELRGVDCVHDLNSFPYPFQDNTFEEVVAINILEHLDDTVKVMEEIWRICRHNAKLILRVPFWNSIDSITDPTHKKLFNQHSFEFFDPTTKRGKNRIYYSKARFKIRKTHYFIFLFRFLKIKNKPFRSLLNCMSYFFCNIIRLIEYELIVLKDKK
jgi:SAM-dependent methyltransferase